MSTTTDQLFARSPQPLYLQVAAIFRRNIQLELWPRGEQVPPLDTLVETLGVSRATVRQAFGLLEREGLIHRSRGSGTFVSQDLPRMLTLTLPKTWAESVAVSRILGDTIMLEGRGDEPMPHSLGMECPYRSDGRYQYLRRVHNTDTGPFCFSEVFLDQDIYREHPARYRSSPVAPLLDQTHGKELSHAGQLLTIVEAGADSAEVLHLPLSTPVAEVRRYACIGDRVVYFARLEIPTRYVQIKFDMMESS